MEFGIFFSYPNQGKRGMKKHYKFRLHRFKVKGMNTVLAYAASMMLSGIPPEVCESTISEVYCSVKKSIAGLLH
jgi:hypothetical protein